MTPSPCDSHRKKHGKKNNSGIEQRSQRASPIINHPADLSEPLLNDYTHVTSVSSVYSNVFICHVSALLEAESLQSRDVTVFQVRWNVQ